MNRISRRLIGGLGGAAALALAWGAPTASATPVPLGLVLDPTGHNGIANVQPDGASQGGAFRTDGGTGWANMSISLTNSTGTTQAGAANYSLWGSVNIDHFTGVTLLGATTNTGVGNDGNDWTFFATTHVTGNGTWASGFYTAASALITMDLWAARGGINVTNFGGADVTAPASSLYDFANLGFATHTNQHSGDIPTCFTTTGNVGGTAASANCLLLASSSIIPYAGTSLQIDDSGNESSDAVRYEFATNFEVDPYASAPGDAFFRTPPDPRTFGLVVISGCAELSNPVYQNISDGNNRAHATPYFYHTFSQQSGNGPCNASNSDGVSHEHNPVAWGFAVPEPGSLALLATGLAGFGLIRRRRRLQS